MKIQRCKGMRDLSPVEMKIFRLVEDTCRECCLKWGYGEVRTPTLEYLHLFTSAGTLTPNMLGKVYSFLDWDGWSGERVVLRPDGTIPTREELLTTNLKITYAVAEAITKYCPDAIVINVANPLDAIVYRLHQQLKPNKAKLMGMAGQLDSARYRYFCAEAAGVSVDNVEAMVLGGHGDTMVPIRSACRIAGLPVTQFIDEIKGLLRQPSLLTDDGQRCVNLVLIAQIPEGMEKSGEVLSRANGGHKQKVLLQPIRAVGERAS